MSLPFWAAHFPRRGQQRRRAAPLRFSLDDLGQVGSIVGPSLLVLSRDEGPTRSDGDGNHLFGLCIMMKQAWLTRALANQHVRWTALSDLLLRQTRPSVNVDAHHGPCYHFSYQVGPFLPSLDNQRSSAQRKAALEYSSLNRFRWSVNDQAPGWTLRGAQARVGIGRALLLWLCGAHGYVQYI